MPTDSASQETTHFVEFIGEPETLERAARVVAEEFRAAEPQPFVFALSAESAAELVAARSHSTA